MRNLNDKIPNALNFKYREFTFSKTAIENNTPNIPNETQWKNIERLAINILQPVRHKFGRIKISSGFRSLELNDLIKGYKYSNHCKGEAADIKSLENVPLIQIANWIFNFLSFRTLIFEFNEWIHIDYRQDHNVKKLKLKDGNHDYTIVSIDYIKDIYS